MKASGKEKNNTGTHKLSINDYFSKGSPIFLLTILFIFMSIASPNFFSLSNFINILKQSAIVGIIAMGQTFVIIGGGIDLSVGAQMALSGSVIAVASAKWNCPPFISVLMGLGTGTLIGFFNGFIITKMKLQDFIATLGTMTICEGVALLITGGLPITGMPSSLLFLGSKSILGIPASIYIFVLISFIAWILLKHTVFGRNAIAIGGNVEAAKVCGVMTGKTKILVNTLCGVFCAVASLLMIGRLNSANALMGKDLETQSITAVVLGGTRMSGGSGSITGTIIGVLTIGILNNGLDLLNVTPFWKRFILGVVILVVVSLDTLRSQRLDKE